MSIKTEAIELVSEFYDGIYAKVELFNSEYEVLAKQCALICIDKMLKTCHTDMDDHYQGMKEEINKLY